MDRKRIEELRSIYTNEFEWQITSACNGFDNLADESIVYLAAYVLMRLEQDKKIKYGSVDDFIASSGDPESRSWFIKDKLRNIWNCIISLKGKYNEEYLQSFILFHETSGRMSSIGMSTPEGVSKLAAKVMKVKAGDVIGDFATGKGGFIRECAALQSDAKYYGNDINTAAVEIAAIRAEIIGGDINIVQEDIFDMKNPGMKFDAIFANYPFGMRAKEAWRNGFNQYEEYIKKNPEFAKAVSLDWLFNKKVYDTIKDSGRAICIMTNGSTWNTLDREARKYFVSIGAVEAVIALPANIFNGTAIGTVMVVFSKDNTSVMMVDARQMCVTGRRYNTITDENISDIINALSGESKKSKRVGFEELETNDFTLNPERYMSEEIIVDDGIPFETIIKRITRGAPLNAAALDDLSSEIPTNSQYLMLANIKNGIIDDELPYLKGIEQKLEKYCIKNNSLIISKNGYPYKVAVAEVNEGHKILANGNLFIIELDEKKADPYFIKAFLESEIGIAELKKITVGATIPNIGVDQLKKILVPCPPIEKQKAISEKYLVMVDEIKILRRKLDKKTSEIQHLFDNSKEG